MPRAAALLAPRPLLVANPVDGRRRRVDQEQAAAAYGFTTRIYEMAGSRGSFRLAMADTPAELQNLWLEHVGRGTR